MRADREIFINSIQDYNRDRLLSLVTAQYDELDRLRLTQYENERIYTEAHIQYCELKEKYDATVKENANLKVALKKEIEKNDLKARSIFGRKTEGLLSLIDAADNKTDEPEDESMVEDNDASYERKSRIIDLKERKGELRNSVSGAGTKKKKSLASSMKNLPQELIYELKVNELNAMYGENNWRIAYWHSHSTLEKISNPYYSRTVLTPAISVGLEHELFTMPYMNPLKDRSPVSASIMADILFRKFVLGLPFNRQAMDYQMQDVYLIKQTIINWANTLVPLICGPVYEFLTECLIGYKYGQSDETTIQVNKDGRGPGHKSYMWIHTSSELLDCPPIIIFCYEETRSTEHLRSFYREFLGYITCDAYVSYQVMEKESDGDIQTSGCMMHARRYFAEAFFVQDVTSLTDEELRALPETQALFLIRSIYIEENQLRELSAEERLAARKEKVAPTVELFFEYVHSLAGSEEILSDRLKKAVTYAINQEQCLKRFLSDGNIPIDNGHVERVIAHSYSIGRANWLFADTISGAKVNAMVYSLAETARANHADVRCYLQYLFEEMPKYQGAEDKDCLSDMVPWSDAYKKYEKNKHQSDLEMIRNLFQEPDKPRTPRKKDPVIILPDTGPPKAQSSDLSA